MTLARTTVILLACVAVSPLSWAQEPAEAPNVILMIADGAGYNTWRAASLYQGRWDKLEDRSAGQVYDGPGWIKVGKACWSLRSLPIPRSLVATDVRVYDPARAWDGTPVTSTLGPHADHFAGYRWHKLTKPDSAATMTHMMTGAKTYDAAINVDGLGRPLRSFASLVREAGGRVGVVTSVTWSHATPACAGDAHNPLRSNYEAIANDMLDGAVADVIMGAGHPGFDHDGRPRDDDARDYKYVGGPATWERLVARDHPKGWVLVEDRLAFQSLAADGRLPDGTRPERIVGTARVAATLQQRRARPAEGTALAPHLTSVPTLAEMALGALRLLNGRGNGYFLMVEGGAVDWAMHANEIDRTVEEMTAFNATVEAVVAWIEAHGGFDRHLLVLTADHDHLLYGPEADKIPFQPVQDLGPGVIPAASFHSTGHSNHLVPVYARGVGAERLRTLADQRDPVHGPYIEDTEIFTLLMAALGRPAVPAITNR